MKYDLYYLIILCHGRLEFKIWSTPSGIYLPSSTDLVVTVILSMNALIGGNLIPDFVVGSLSCFFTHFTSKFIVAQNRITEIVKPVTIPI